MSQRENMQRVGVLNGNNITYDHDISGLVRGVTDWGVIEWWRISSSKVLAPLQAIVPVERSNGQKLLVYFESDEQVQLPTSWSYKVYIEVDQAKINDGSGNAENGTGIASIKTGENVPNKNCLQIARIGNGQVAEQRTLSPKIQSIAQRTTTLENKVETAEGNISRLTEAGIPSYIIWKYIVWEAYNLGDALVKKEDGRLYKSIYKTRLRGRENYTVTQDPARRNNAKFQFEKPQGKEARLVIKGLSCPEGKWGEIIVSEPHSRGGNYVAHIVPRPYSPDLKDYTLLIPATAPDQLFLHIRTDGDWHQVSIEEITLIEDKQDGGAKYYPREIKGVGETVECTLAGEHTDGNIITHTPRLVELNIWKSLSGTAKVVWTPPAPWYLTYAWDAQHYGNQRCFINGTVQSASDGRSEKRIFVEKEPMVFEVRTNSGVSRSAKIELRTFTTVM